MYTDKSIKQYLDDLAAKSPAPGGGSAAAMAGAMASALISMVLNFTIGKEGYEKCQSDARKLLVKSEEFRREFTRYFEEDIGCYDLVLTAKRLPKETAKDIKIREKALKAAFRTALAVPLKVCKDSVGAISMCPWLAKKANKNLICDTEAPVRLLEAAFYSGKINCLMNLKGIDNKEVELEILSQLEVLEKKLHKYKKISLRSVSKITGY